MTRVLAISVFVLAVVGVTVIAGCDDLTFHDRPTARPAVATASVIRSARRAYDGAPPVIPHAPQGAACTACHTPEGKPTPPLGVAPANPHGADGKGLAVANCRQCHVFAAHAGDFAANNFSGVPHLVRRGDRLYPSAPPAIPHPLVLRENCVGCHDGPAARPEIRCSHPLRTNCLQCHLRPSEPAGEFAAASTVSSGE